VEKEKEEEVKIPPYSYSLQHTKIPSKVKDWIIKEFGKKSLGKPHSEFIGKNKESCKKLFGLGYSLQKRFGNFGLGPYSNHIWIPQVNEADPDKKIMQVCLNCGSLFINDIFIPYTELK